jgi:hypothetical protein
VSCNYGFFSVQLDLLGGDTCHHWMGDTWHMLTSSSAWPGDVAAEWHADVAVYGSLAA